MEKEERFAALYARVSTDAQFEEGYSIDAQKEMLLGYCASRQISDYHFYIDGGFSGSHMERPQLRALMEDVRADRISHVIVYKLDRLSRSQKDTLYLIEDLFNPHGVSFVSLNENMDTATPIGRAMLGIMSAFAQLERETIRERTRMGMRERVRSGLWMGGGKIPFGYDYDRTQGILVPNADAETVRQMYQLYLSGYSMMAVAQAVGLKYERLAQQILLRKTNVGVICYNGVEYQGQHTPLVSRDVYERTIAEYQRRSRRALTTSRHLLSGLLVCGVCGAKMRYQKWGKRGCKIYCYSQDVGKPHLSHGLCDNEKLWADEVEATILLDVFAMGETCESREETADDTVERTLRARRETLERKIKLLYNLYAEREDALLLETIEENRRALHLAERELEDYTRAANDAAQRRSAFAEIKGLREAWDYLTFQEKQTLLRSVIDRIVITRSRIDIHYRLSDASDGEIALAKGKETVIDA